MPPWKRLAASALVTIAVFAVLEATARAYYLARDVIAATSTDPAPRPRMHAYTYWEDDGLYYLEPGFDERGVRINSAGLRGAEVTERTPPGTYRILVIGDSTVFGLPGDDCPYPAQLEKVLRAQTGRSVEVLNGGVEGYNSAMALHRLERKDLLRFSPDLVILSIGWNDLYGSQIFDSGGASVLARLIGSSAALTAVREFYAEVIRPALAERFGHSSTLTDADIERFYPTRYVANVRTTIELARAKRAAVVLTTHPTPLAERMTDGELLLARPHPYFTTDPRHMWLLYERYEQARRDIAAAERVQLVDVASAFDGLDKTQYFFDALHVYCPGNVIIAKTIANAIGPMVAGR